MRKFSSCLSCVSDISATGSIAEISAPCDLEIFNSVRKIVQVYCVEKRSDANSQQLSSFWLCHLPGSHQSKESKISTHSHHHPEATRSFRL